MQHTISRLGQRKVNVEVSKKVPSVVPAWAKSWTIVGLLPVYICQVRLIRILNSPWVWECPVADWPPLQGVFQALTSWLMGSTPAALVIKILNKPRAVNRKRMDGMLKISTLPGNRNPARCQFHSRHLDTMAGLKLARVSSLVSPLADWRQIQTHSGCFLSADVEAQIRYWNLHWERVIRPELVLTPILFSFRYPLICTW